MTFDKEIALVILLTAQFWNVQAAHWLWVGDGTGVHTGVPGTHRLR